MNKEKLTQLNDLQKKIDGLTEHKATITKWADEIKKGQRYLALVQYDERDIQLKNEFLLLPTEKLVQLYLEELDKEITAKQTQFDHL